MLSVALTIAIAAGAYYFIVQRPHNRMRAEHEQFLHGIGPGDHVMTVGGIIGKLLEIDARSGVIEVAPGHVIRVATDGISRRVEAMPIATLPHADAEPVQTHQIGDTPVQQPWQPQQPQQAPSAATTAPPASTPAPLGALPRFTPTFTAAPQLAPTPAPVPVTAPVQVAPPVPAPQRPMPDPQDPRDSATADAARPAGQKLRRRSEAPDGFGPTASHQDPHVASALEQAASERDGLADAWRRATADLVDTRVSATAPSNTGEPLTQDPTSMPDPFAPAAPGPRVFPEPARLPELGSANTSTSTNSTPLGAGFTRPGFLRGTTTDTSGTAATV